MLTCEHCGKQYDASHASGIRVLQFTWMYVDQPQDVLNDWDAQPKDDLSILYENCSLAVELVAGFSTRGDAMCDMCVSCLKEYQTPVVFLEGWDIHWENEGKELFEQYLGEIIESWHEKHYEPMVNWEMMISKIRVKDELETFLVEVKQLLKFLEENEREMVRHRQALQELGRMIEQFYKEV